MLAISSTIHGSVSQGITSAPVKYSAMQIGHRMAAFRKPMMEKVNAICPTGGSPITLRNIT